MQKTGILNWLSGAAAVAIALLIAISISYLQLEEMRDARSFAYRHGNPL